MYDGIYIGSQYNIREFTTELGHHCIITDTGHVWDCKLCYWANINRSEKTPVVLLRRPNKKFSMPLLLLTNFKPYDRTDEIWAVPLNGNHHDLHLYNWVWSHVKSHYAIGEKYERLTTLSTFLVNNVVNCNCVCDCGNMMSTTYNKLRMGHTRSCGCLKLEMLKQRVVTHGLSNHPLYAILSGMHKRCENPNSVRYHRYGGRGIKVCPEWSIDKVSDFVKWAEYTGWYEGCGLQIDRINNDGDYEPSNCRWVTPKENMRNSTNVTNIQYNGNTQCITEWSNELGIPVGTISGRLQRGMDVEQALSQKRVPRRF